MSFSLANHSEGGREGGLQAGHPGSHSQCFLMSVVFPPPSQGGEGGREGGREDTTRTYLESFGQPVKRTICDVSHQRRFAAPVLPYNAVAPASLQPEPSVVEEDLATVP